jgi:hypothetical protein
MTIEVAHCSKRWTKPENDTCELWINKGYNPGGEFEAMRELMKMEPTK